MFFDSHCHLNCEELYIKKDQLIKEAKERGVKKIVVPAYDYESSLLTLEIIKEENIYGVIGVQPTEIEKTDVNKTLKLIDENKNNKKLVAIGEIGLDYYWVKEKEKQEKQKEVFIEQIKKANEYHLPIVIHARDSLEDTLEIIKKYPPVMGGVMHCFSGDVALMEQFVKLGMYISFAGPVTFKNNHILKEVARVVPLDKMLIETDAPYLSPHPHRGKENNPKNVVLVAEEIAKLRGMETSEIGQIAYDNTCRLFKIYE